MIVGRLTVSKFGRVLTAQTEQDHTSCILTLGRDRFGQDSQTDQKNQLVNDPIQLVRAIGISQQRDFNHVTLKANKGRPVVRQLKNR